MGRRSSCNYETMEDLKNVIYQYNPAQTESTKFQTLIKASQALRIMVNQEIDNIKNLFDALPALCRNNKSSLAIMIGFHELEFDAIEAGKKKIRQDFKVEDYFKGQVPSREEIERNSPSRSAKLYAWEFREKGDQKKTQKSHEFPSKMQDLLSQS